VALALDKQGNLYIADKYEDFVRKVSNGIITTVAGNGSQYYGGDGVPATQTPLNLPKGVAVDAAGDIYIGDSGNNRIREVNTSGIISTYAGTGAAGFNGDGLPPSQTQLIKPIVLTFDASGNLFFIDSTRVRKIANGLVTTVAGNGTIGMGANNVPATSTSLNTPASIAVDPAGNVFIGEERDIREVTTDGMIHTLSVSTPVPLTSQTLNPWGLVIDASGNLYDGEFGGVVEKDTPVANFCGYTIPIPAPQLATTTSLQINVATGAGCSWAVHSFNLWITPVNTSGSGNGTVNFTLAPNQAPSSRTGTVSIAGQVFSIIQLGESAPFGVMDQPTNNTSNLAGAVAVTGWALSPTGIATVGIWRDPVPGEPSAANGYVFVDDADLVPDTRPDVASAYPGYPNNDWGWGLLVLTNELPGTGGQPLGNGSYRFHAIAVDNAGLTTEIGTSSISVNNAASVAPFGTIDTPAQGQTISGTYFVNFGWALTPQPNSIPTDGSTITVFIDNVAVGHPVYDQPRSDISTLFPGLANSGGAVGYYIFDTTTLLNGLHTISWVAKDSANRATGLGSRYFIVQNQ
jgi:hypothetical protein